MTGGVAAGRVRADSEEASPRGAPSPMPGIILRAPAACALPGRFLQFVQNTVIRDCVVFLWVTGRQPEL